MATSGGSGGRRGKRAKSGSAPIGSQGAGLVSEELLASIGLHELIPAPLAAWRPLVADGLSFFLERLPGERLMAIVAEQMRLPADASPAARLVALLSRCPTLHKLGQVVAHHPQLNPDLRRHLQTLESLPGTTPLPALLARIRAQLPEDTGDAGDTGDAAIELGSEALAEGSVAVVVPFTYHDNGKLCHGVFKVLKPGVEQALNDELAILVELAPYLEERSRQLGLPPIDYRDTLDTVQHLMIKEVHLDVEQKNLRAAAAFYADEPLIQVPRVLPWCTPTMTAMERIFGVKVTDAVLSPKVRQKLADTMISALLGQPFWSDDAQAVVHADLHAGNLFMTDDGRLAVLDWSLTAALTKAQREALVAIALGGLMLDAESIRRTIATLSDLTHDDPVLAEAVERALDRVVMQGQLPGFDWLLALFDDLALHTTTGFWEDFVLLRKSWLSLSGVIGDLVGDLSPDRQLATVALQRFLGEMPARALARPGATNFATHVSNAELLRLCASPWLISIRYWERCWRQGLSFFGLGGEPATTRLSTVR